VTVAAVDDRLLIVSTQNRIVIVIKRNTWI